MYYAHTERGFQCNNTKKLEERREEKKMLYGRRVERLDDSRLVKIIMKKMRDCGSAI